MSSRQFHLRSTSRAWKSRYAWHRRFHVRHLSTKYSEPTPYDSTVSNLTLTSDTRVIFQGFTGRVGTTNARESIAWGTNIVGGVKPGVSPGHKHLDLPVLPTVREAVKVLKPDATGIYVAAHQAAGAIEEAIEAEVPLIVAVAEHIPVHDMLRIHSILRTQSKSRLVGANAPGIISPISKCRIGFQPLPQYMAGPVGVVAKSGTLSYESVASLTRAGVGQSLCIGMGGDMLAGTNFVDALKMFEHDDDTQGIVVIGEVGGRAEEDAAEWILEYRKRSLQPKPIAAIVGGLCVKDTKVFGHAGAWKGTGEGSAEMKWNALRDAGVVMVDHPSKFGPVMKNLLGKSPKKHSSVGQQQIRSMHTWNRRPNLPNSRHMYPVAGSKRRLYLQRKDAIEVSKQYGLNIDDHTRGLKEENRCMTGIVIDRESRRPCLVMLPNILASNATSRQQPEDVLKIPFNMSEGPGEADIKNAITSLPINDRTEQILDNLENMYRGLWKMFKELEGIQLLVAINSRNGSPSLPSFFFDDAAFRVGKRQAELHAQEDKTKTAPEDAEAKSQGIVYIKLGDETHNVGTLVNGAGLAMNTVDALAARGVKATNFMDTGGLATSATVAAGFGLILSDSRVKVIFVNIFGGLTLGDMIAEGILMAFKEKDVHVPVVVRIRGTNEKEGQIIIRDSGLPLYAYDDFDAAAAKVKELVQNVEAQKSTES